MSVKESANRSLMRRLRSNKNAFRMLCFEPMFGIVFNLFNPFFYKYMVDLGCTPVQIGLITTVGLVFQFIFSVLAAPITDRMGRRKATVIFDIISWSGATLIWAVAQNFYFFLAAAVIQAVNRIVYVSWTCLLVEDTEKDLLVTLFSWITVANLLAGLIVPFASPFISRYDLVTVMHWLIGIACAVMTLMFILRNIAVKETSVGRTRMEESKNESIGLQLMNLLKTVLEIWKTPQTRFMFLLTAVYNIAITVRGSFFSLYITNALGLSDAYIGYFAFGTSAIMLLVYFFVQPRLVALQPKAPLNVSLLLCMLGFAMLGFRFPSVPVMMAILVSSMVLTSVGTAVAQPFIDGLSHASMDNDKRANMTGVLFSLTLLTSAPFGYIGGELFHLNPQVLFVVASGIYFVCFLMMVLLFDKGRKTKIIKTVDLPR